MSDSASDSLDHDGARDDVLTEVERLIAARDYYKSRCEALESTLNESHKELRKNQQLLHYIAEHAPAVLYVKDLEGRFLLSNRRHAALLGHERDEIIGKREADLLSPGEADAIDAITREVVRTGEPAQQEFSLGLPDGLHWFLEDVFPLYEEDGAAFAIGGVATDVTQRKRTEQELSQTIEILIQTQRQLVESEKMAALAGLVAGVAHEINTPVGIGVTAASHLCDRTHYVHRRYAASKLTRADMEGYLETALQSSQMILSNLKRASELVQSFKLVAVDQSSEVRREFHVRQYLEGIVRSLRPKLKPTLISVELEGGEFSMVNFPGALSQVITNLVVNSLTHAYSEGERGRVRIAATRGDEAIRLEYSDDGCGIPPEHLSKIFEPFFTTRRGRGGSGLGLHVLYNLVTRRMGGTVRCTSDGERGTSFLIELPRQLDEPSETDP